MAMFHFNSAFLSLKNNAEKK